MAFTREDSQATTAIPTGLYAITVTKAFDLRDPVEGEKDGVPYYIHSQGFSAKIEEFISGDEEAWDAFSTFEGTNPTFIFEYNVGEKFLDTDQASEFMESLPADRKELFAGNVRSARSAATSLMKIHEDLDEVSTETFGEIMTGNTYVARVSSYNKKSQPGRTFYNVELRSFHDE